MFGYPVEQPNYRLTSGGEEYWPARPISGRRKRSGSSSSAFFGARVLSSRQRITNAQTSSSPTGSSGSALRSRASFIGLVPRACLGRPSRLFEIVSFEKPAILCRCWQATGPRLGSLQLLRRFREIGCQSAGEQALRTRAPQLSRGRLAHRRRIRLAEQRLVPGRVPSCIGLAVLLSYGIILVVSGR